ncbi:glycoside hydrolase family 13 protein [Plicaturopsis crispa FD-325 SS-3]|nr:glycoside hydrolase family 13 protein [Plicaturopsis crispa FD-325 SS-3]
MVLLTFLAPLVLVVPVAFAASAEEWQSRSIYQLITDRFATTDDKGVPCDTNERAYCGGSWKGITNHLDYIQDMGFDAVWISPVSANIEGNITGTGQAFHGYWTEDISRLNDHFGTAADLQNLSSSLHSRGMYLMFDVVVNHLAGSSLPNLNYSAFGPLANASLFHPECWIVFSPDTDNTNQTQVEQCWLGDKNLPLADLNTEDPAVVSTMYQWIQGLIKTYDVDGVRIDTVKHIRKDFWPGFTEAAGVFTIGEVFSNETEYVAPWTEGLSAVLDYPGYFAMAQAFSSTKGNISSLIEITSNTQSSYSKGAFMTGSFMSNHDQPRFMSMTQDASLIQNALTWPFVHDSIPILYYGEEQGYQGGSDPYNREALWLSAYVANKTKVEYVKTLNTIRKTAMGANGSFLTTSMEFIPQTNTALMAISKPPLVALFANVGVNDTSGAAWTLPAGTFRASEPVVDVLTCNAMMADGSGGMVVQAHMGQPQVIMAGATLSKTGKLCPDKATEKYATGGGMVGRSVSWVVTGGALAFGLAKVLS